MIRALLAAFFSAKASALGVRLEWLPPEKRSDRVIVEYLDPAGTTTGRSTVQVSASGSLELPAPPEGTVSVAISTPRHAGCRVPMTDSETCSLRSLPVVRPFKAGAGQLWVRSAGKGPFRIVPALDPVWGVEGFAFPIGSIDVVAAPDEAPAQLFLAIEAGALRLAEIEERAIELRGRLESSKGTAFSGRFSLAVEELPISHPDAPRRAAWADFYRDHGVHIERASFRVAPLASDPLVFLVKLPDAPDLRFAASRYGTGKVADAGTLRVLSGGLLSITLSLESRLLPAGATFRVVATLSRPDPGVSGSATRRGEVSRAVPLVLAQLPYGAWSLSLYLGDLLIGTESVDVLSERQSFTWRVTDETVSGKVFDEAGKPVFGAVTSISFPPRAKVQAGEDGAFELTFPHAGGEVVVFARFSGLSVPQSLRLDPRAAEARKVEFRLPGYRLAASIRSASDNKGIPKAAFKVVLTPKEKGKGRQYLTFPADDEGKLTVHGIPEGTVGFQAIAPGYGESVARSAELSKAHPEESVEIQLERVAKISISVADIEGRPIPGAKLSGPLTDGGFAPPADANGDGRFDIEIPMGRVSVVVAWAPGYRIGFFPVSPNVARTVLSILPVGGQAEIELRRADGRHFEGQPFWQLVAAGIPIDSGGLRDAFLANGCAEVDPRLIRSSARLGGCLMPGAYALLVPVREDEGVRLYRTEQFDPTSGTPARVVALVP